MGVSLHRRRNEQKMQLIILLDENLDPAHLLDQLDFATVRNGARMINFDQRPLAPIYRELPDAVCRYVDDASIFAVLGVIPHWSGYRLETFFATHQEVTQNTASHS